MKKTLFILFLLIIGPITLALGVTPGRRVIEFEPDTNKTVQIRVINNQNKDFHVILFARGDLKKYIEVEQDKIHFNKQDNQKKAKYNIYLPSNLTPGTHKTDIVVREVTSEKGKKGININYLVSVISELHVTMPYPSKYIEADMNIVAKPGKVKFYLPVYSKSKKDIDNVKVKILIFDRTKKITEFWTDKKSLKSKQTTELTGVWKTNRTGFYNAKAIIYYDNNTKKIEKEFFAGEFLLRLLDISVKDFTLGGIAKFNILVENIGNREAKDAYTKMILNDKKGNKVVDMESSRKNIPPKTKTEMYTYWDTEEVKKGEYQGKTVLGYKNKTSENRIRTLVSKDYIKTEIIGITGKITAEKERKPELIKFLLIIIGVLVLTILLLIFLRRKK